MCRAGIGIVRQGQAAGAMGDSDDDQDCRSSADQPVDRKSGLGFHDAGVLSDRGPGRTRFVRFRVVRIAGLAGMSPVSRRPLVQVLHPLGLSHLASLSKLQREGPQVGGAVRRGPIGRAEDIDLPLTLPPPPTIPLRGRGERVPLKLPLAQPPRKGVLGGPNHLSCRVRTTAFSSRRRPNQLWAEGSA
jgi:hypothetical protein